MQGIKKNGSTVILIISAMVGVCSIGYLIYAKIKNTSNTLKQNATNANATNANATENVITITPTTINPLTGKTYYGNNNSATRI